MSAFSRFAQGGGPRTLHPIRDLARNSPARAAALIFVLAAVVFSVLLSLPISSASNRPTPLIDAFFTGVSAVTVTGLTTLDTATHWSPFGQIVILLAIQIGGLGIVTIALMLARAVTRHLGLQTKVFAQQGIGTSKLGEVGTLLRIVVLTTLTIQGVLFLLLLPPFVVVEGNLWDGIWNALFYAVSSFNNAGFSIHPGGLPSLEGNLWILVPIALGVFVGSFGFPVFLTLLMHRWNPKRWTLHTKLTLSTTLILLVLGSLAWGALEWNNAATVGAESPLDKVLHSVFASVMMRSGGFSIIDTGASHPATLLVSDALMFVGGGSASTAGGIKVTTLAVLFLAILAEARGDKDVRAVGRMIPRTFGRHLHMVGVDCRIANKRVLDVLRSLRRGCPRCQGNPIVDEYDTRDVLDRVTSRAALILPVGGTREGHDPFLTTPSSTATPMPAASTSGDHSSSDCTAS